MKYQKALSIISFILMIVALLTAVITDFVLFKDAIFTFIGAIVISIIIFIFLIFAMLVSFILIFGVFLVKENGFWPLSVTLGVFKDILNDITITSEQVSSFITIRIILLIICIITLVMSIIAKHKVKDQTKVPLKGMSVVTFIFSILGILSAASLLIIASIAF